MHNATKKQLCSNFYLAKCCFLSANYKLFVPHRDQQSLLTAADTDQGPGHVNQPLKFHYDFCLNCVIIARKSKQ